MRPFPLPQPDRTSFRLIFIALIALSLPAFLINLHLMTFIEDEAIRSLVALEMWYNGDYISPTLHNTPYFKKPPLYNWVLVFSSKLIGYFGEWPSRIPTIVFLGLFSYTVYRFYRPKWGSYSALLLSGILLTTGRILFWESLLGLIDICFSWVIFIIWITLYSYEQNNKFWHLYLFIWMLTAVGFLLKGLPVLVFTALSLFTWLLIRGKWKKLFHPAQFTGFALFILSIGTYYTLFAFDQNVEAVLQTLWSESSQRTPLEFGIWKTLLHLIEFPLEMIYHFLPWSLFLLFLFKPSIWKIIWSDSLLKFHVLMIAGNIWVYWISPQVYPRYLLMFIPFFSALCLAGYFRQKQQNPTSVKIVEYVLAGLMIALTLGSFSPLFIDRLNDLSFLLPKVLATVALLGGLSLLYFKFSEHRLLILILFLLAVRIGFNWFVLPPRNAGDWANNCREQSRRIGRQYQDKPLFLWKDVHLYYTNGFYISAERNKPLERTYGQMKPGKYYIVHPDDRLLNSDEVITVDSFCIRHEHQFMKIAKLQRQ